MKKNYVIIFALVAAFATLFSCQKEIASEESNETGTAIMTVNVDEIITKTFLEESGSDYTVSWSSGDKIAAYEVGNGVVAASKTSSTELAAATTDASFTMDFSGNTSLSANYSYLFVYPASALSQSSEIYRSRIKWDQTFSATSFDKDADLMISEAVMDQATRPTSVNVGFARVGATVLMNIKAPTTSDTIQSIEFSTTEGNIAGYLKVYPTTGTYDTDVYDGRKQINLTPAAATTYTGTIPVWFRCAAIDLVDNFTVTVHTTGKDYTKTVDLASASKTLKFENGALTKFNVDMTTASACVRFTVGNEIASIFPATKAGIKFSNEKGTGSTDPVYASPYNWYKNSDVTISAGTTGSISRVVINYSSTGLSVENFGSDDDDATYVIADNTGTWNVGADPVSSVTFTNKTNKVTFSSIYVYFTGTPNATVVTSTPTIAFGTDAYDLALGGTRTNIATSNYNNGTITYTSLDESKATVNPTTGEVTPVAVGNVTIRATIAGSTTPYSVINSNYADCTVTVTEPATYDVLNLALTGVSGNSYTAWSGKDGSYSSAVYAGQCAGGNNAIQLRAASPSGIISTTSGGYLANVTVYWNSNTSDDRTLQVYGKNTPYSGSGDLANANTRGTLLGSIVNGTSTSLDVSDYYEYMGLYATGALYLDEIRVTWGEARTRVASPTGVTATPSGTSIVVTWTDASDANIGKYIVSCTGQDPIEVNPGVKTATFTGLDNGNYDVTVQAKPTDVTIATGTRAYSTPVNVSGVTVSAAPVEVWQETAIGSIKADDVFVIVGTKSGKTYVLSNNCTSSAASATAITIADGKVSGTVQDIWKWNLTTSAGKYTFYPDGETTTWLTFSDSNNGVRVGTGSNKAFTYSDSMLSCVTGTNTRYLSIYNTQDWRCYTSGSSNVTVKFYVLQP